MSSRRNYIAPFWWLLVLAAIKLAILLYIIDAMSDSPLNRQLMLRTVLPYQVAQAIVLVAEAIVYWYIRRWQYRRLLAIWHIILWYTGLLLPLLLFFIIQFSSLFVSSGAHSNAQSALKSSTQIFYWSCLIIGHIFFAVIILEGIKNRKKEQTPDTGLLEPMQD